MKQVWLNITNGEFSNSWSADDPLRPEACEDGKDRLQQAARDGWKLIEYRCVNDPDFELYNKMKLR
jgi:hypothetical protein